MTLCRRRSLLAARYLPEDESLPEDTFLPEDESSRGNSSLPEDQVYLRKSLSLKTTILLEDEFLTFTDDFSPCVGSDQSVLL